MKLMTILKKTQSTHAKKENFQGLYRNFPNALKSEIRLPKQLGCLTSRKLLFTPSKSKNISTNISICTHESSWVPNTTILNSKVVNSCKKIVNIYIVWNVKKLV